MANPLNHTSTANDMTPAVGSGADMEIKVGSDFLLIQVTIQDLRMVWNRADALVQPVAGEGTTWVSVERLRNFRPNPAL